MDSSRERVKQFTDAGYWLVDDPEVSRSVLCDDRFSSSTLQPSFTRFVSPQTKVECAYLIEVLSRWFVDLDPPEHTTQRRLCQPHFSRNLLNRLEPQIREMVNGVLDRLPEHPDAIRDIAQPVSAGVMSLALGLGKLDSDVLHGWSNDIARFIGAVYRPDYAVAAQRSVKEMEALLRNRMSSQHLTEPSPVYSGNDPRQSMAAHTMILFGGLETSSRLIGQLIWAILSREFDEQKDPNSLTESVLRKYPPVKYVTRIASCNVEVDGMAIRRGELVLVSLAGSGDSSSPVLAFGLGRHFCIGMPLTMLESRIVVEEFRKRYPDAAPILADTVPSENNLYHGFEKIPFTPVKAGAL